ncbi:MAG: hypothetical protein P8Y15_03985 [Gemmatimonadales bacterium]
MPRSSPVPEWVPPDLPTSPGVYRFLSETGEPLYIGKSVNLRRRVRGYFYGGGPNGRLADMAFLARAVAYRQTGSDLEARLLEARAILNHRPRFNRAIKNRWRGWYLEIDQGVPFPRPRVVRAVRSPSARYFGPYAGRFIPLKISRLMEDLFGLRSCAGSIRPDVEGPACLRFEIGTCPAPCIGAEGVNGYRKRVREAIEVLTDVDRARLMRSRLLADSGGMTDGSQTGREPSAWRRLEWLDELETYRSVLERPSRQPSLLAILPHPEPDRRVLLPLASGRVLPMRSANTGPRRWRHAVLKACYAVRVRDLRMDSILQPDEMVISLIVRRWLESGAPDGAVYDLGTMTDREVLESTIRGSPSPQAPGA